MTSPAAPAKPPVQFCIGFLTPNTLFRRFQESLALVDLYDRSRKQPQLQNRILPCFCGHYYGPGRNAMTRMMLKEWADECDVFVSIDNDMVFTPMDLFRLVSLVDEDTRPIVSGLYHAVERDGEQVRPLVFKEPDPFHNVACWDLPENELVETSMVPAGFLAVSVHVFFEMQQELGDHWWDFDQAPDGRFIAEDEAFSRRARQILRCPLYVHTGIDVGHEKPKVFYKRHAQKGGLAHAVAKH